MDIPQTMSAGCFVVGCIARRAKPDVAISCLMVSYDCSPALHHALWAGSAAHTCPGRKCRGVSSALSGFLAMTSSNFNLIRCRQAGKPCGTCHDQNGFFTILQRKRNIHRLVCV